MKKQKNRKTIAKVVAVILIAAMVVAYSITFVGYLF